MAKNLAVQLQKIASNAQVTAQKIANEATEKSFKYNREEANTARTWQTEMSNTAHQREVADLKKAGLNPVLAANQGAQSYTTSSAQAQANDPSGAISNLAATEMSGMAQGYSADRAAAATRYAAQQSAAAMRAAAAQSSAAQIYAANRAYDAQKYAWDKKQEMQKYEYKNKPASSIAGLVDKLTKNSGLQDTVIKSNTVKSVVKSTASLMKNPSEYFKTTVGIATGNPAALLNGLGKLKIDNNLRRLGVTPNRITRNFAIRSMCFGSISAWNALIRYMPRKQVTYYKGHSR